MRQSRGRARIGVLVPFTNTNLEPDFALMCPDGVSLHFARLGGYDEEEIPGAEQMQGLGAADLDEPLRLLAGVQPDVVIYGCTSATLTHGLAFDRALAKRIAQLTGAQPVTAAHALLTALQKMNIQRIGFASPYVPAINDLAIRFLAEAGVETCARSEVTSALSNTGQGALPPEEVHRLGLGADHPEAEAVVLSCTDMRSVETIERLERDLGKPVVTSNQAMMFQALSLLGWQDSIPEFGRLLREEFSKEVQQLPPSKGTSHD